MTFFGGILRHFRHTATNQRVIVKTFFEATKRASETTRARIYNICIWARKAVMLYFGYQYLLLLRFRF